MYRSSTREAQLSALPLAVTQALAGHASANQLQLGGARVWVTRSENPVAESFFGKLLGRRANPVDPDAVHDTVLVLHRTHILIATSRERREPSVLSVPLAVASVSRGSGIASRLQATGQDDGISITGFPTHDTATSAGSYFFKLGPEPEGVTCARAVEAAIIAAKNPR